MIDCYLNKMIHADEFRLRVLLTNQCDKDCYFCLNDFQKKKPIKMANAQDVVDCIRAYGQFMKFKKEKSIVTFSGGEPGLYSLLSFVIAHASFYCNIVKVVTNGRALGECYLPYVDTWHIGVTEKDQNIIEWSKLVKNMVIQIVVTDSMKRSELFNLVKFYRENNIPVKLFVDFFSENKPNLEDLILYIKSHFSEISTRFTGKQINRGNACLECEKDCVTLKALWYFPNGLSSTCPQGVVEKYDDDSWDETVEKAYEAHRR